MHIAITLHHFFYLLSGAMEHYGRQKRYAAICHFHVSLIQPQNFDTADIMCFTIGIPYTFSVC